MVCCLSFCTLLPWLLLAALVGLIVRRYLLPYLPKITDPVAERNFFEKNRCIWITGASSGIGKALAEHLRPFPNVQVVISARNESALADVKRDLNSHGVRDVMVLPLDLQALAQPITGPQLAEKAVSEVQSKFGRVDILIHNGGMSQRGDVLSMNPEAERRLMDTNFTGAVALTHAVLPGMIQRRSGFILAVSSVQGLLPIAFRSSYGASKHAMNAYFHSLRYEVASFGVHVCVMCPGYVATNISKNAIDANGEKYGKTDTVTAQGYSPSYISSLCYAALRERRSEVLVADLLARSAIMLHHLAPALLTKIMIKRTDKERNNETKKE